SSSELKNKISFNADSREVNSYLKGETLIVSGEKGYTGVCVEDFPLGWAKQTGDMLKNLYPKGWRKMS
ncbi:MAG TPA: SAM-dependent methyltransferase, partial [Ruminiclostridium sp.]|nr:SAM-dependent methyltransferase [Ruminiclostridium sp.]